MIYLFSSYNNENNWINYFYENPCIYRCLDIYIIDNIDKIVYKWNPHIDNDDISFIKMKLPSINKRIILEDLYPDYVSNKATFRECVEKRIEEIIFEKI